MFNLAWRLKYASIKTSEDTPEEQDIRDSEQAYSFLQAPLKLGAFTSI